MKYLLPSLAVLGSLAWFYIAYKDLDEYQARRAPKLLPLFAVMFTLAWLVLTGTANAAELPLLPAFGQVGYSATLGAGTAPVAVNVKIVPVPGAASVFRGQELYADYSGHAPLDFTSSTPNLIPLTSPAYSIATSCTVATWYEAILPWTVTTTNDGAARGWYLNGSYNTGSFGYMLCDSLVQDNTDWLSHEWASGIPGGSNASGGSFALQTGVTMRMLRVQDLNCDRTTTPYTWTVKTRNSSYILQGGRWASTYKEDQITTGVNSLSVGISPAAFYYTTMLKDKGVFGVGNYVVTLHPSGFQRAGWCYATDPGDRAKLWASEDATAIVGWTGGEAGSSAIDTGGWTGGTHSGWDLDNLIGQIKDGVSGVDWWWPMKQIASW